jgi:hypothetical protein
LIAVLTLGIIDLQSHPTTHMELQQIESMNISTVGSNIESTFDAIQMYIHGKLDYLATSHLRELICSMPYTMSKHRSKLGVTMADEIEAATKQVVFTKQYFVASNNHWTILYLGEE